MVDEIWSGYDTPSFDVNNYNFKSLTDNFVKTKVSFINFYVDR